MYSSGLSTAATDFLTALQNAGLDGQLDSCFAGGLERQFQKGSRPRAAGECQQDSPAGDMHRTCLCHSALRAAGARCLTSSPCCPVQVLSSRIDELESASVGQQVSDNTHLSQL